jgi:hypothetical protein
VLLLRIPASERNGAFSPVKLHQCLSLTFSAIS